MCLVDAVLLWLDSMLFLSCDEPVFGRHCLAVKLFVCVRCVLHSQLRAAPRLGNMLPNSSSRLSVHLTHTASDTVYLLQRATGSRKTGICHHEYMRQKHTLT